MNSFIMGGLLLRQFLATLFSDLYYLRNIIILRKGCLFIRYQTLGIPGENILTTVKPMGVF